MALSWTRSAMMPRPHREHAVLAEMKVGAVPGEERRMQAALADRAAGVRAGVAEAARAQDDGHDMCGRPLRSKRNLQERCGPWSGADMCAAFDAAHTPQARM